MHAREEEVDAEVRHGDAQEGKGDVDVIHQRLAENRQTLRMHHYGIYHEGDECPRLLAVPTPIRAPTDICPDGSDEDAESHRGECWVEEETAQRLHPLTTGTPADAQNTTKPGEYQKYVTHHDDTDMYAEIRAV